METIEKETCPICKEKTLTMTEDEKDIPFFGQVYLFSMTCSNCKFHKADVEAVEMKDPIKITFITEDEEDMNVRVVKSSQATVKIPTLKMSVESSPNSNGYVTNIEGLINRFEKIVHEQKDTTDDETIKKTAKNLLKKIWKVKLGEIPIKIIIEDLTGNSAIISDKAIVEKLK